MLKKILKQIFTIIPIPITKNQRYDFLTKKILRRLTPNSNCIDVGCLKGEILDLMLISAPQGTHFGIEPIPQQYNFLKEKYASLNNVNIVNIAASNHSGTATFNYVISNPSYSGLVKRDYDRSGEIDTKIEVHTELLDNVIPENLPISFIKIDVEGAEMQVLEGASKIVNRWKPLIVFEHGLGASNHYGTTPDQIFRYFSEKSMLISTLDNYAKNRPALTLQEFNKQYFDKINYYFVAHS